MILEKVERLLKNRDSIYVILIYSVLTLIMTYPVAFKAGYVPGLGDVFSHLWFFWWFKYALISGLNPFFTENMFYPNGVSLMFSMEPGNAIFLVPLQQIFGLINSYKILFLFTFIASGYGTYLLVKYLTGDKRASFISGLIFMFSPYHFAHALGHTNLMSIQWIPFYVLFLIRIARENKKSDAVYAAFFLFLTAITSYYYLIYLSIFTLMFFVYYLYVDKQCLLKKNIMKRVCLLILIFGLLFSPFVYLILKENPFDKSNNIYAGGSSTYSADVLGFFIPTLFHPIFKNYVSPIYNNFTGNIAEYTVFAGYTILVLAFLSVCKIKTKDIRFWTLSAIVFALISLGPILHINGVLIEGKIGSLLPYTILMKLPLFSIVRVPSRWDVLVMLSLAILAGYGISYIFKRFDRKFFNRLSYKDILTVVFTGFIIFEFLAIPYPTSSAKVPDFYHQIKNDPDDYAILEIPNMFLFSPSLYYQTIHGKKLVNGYVSRTPQKIINFIASTPPISLLFNISEKKPVLNDIINQDNSNISESVLNYYNIRYVVLHKKFMSHDQIGYSNRLLQKILNKQPEIYEKDGLIVYRVEKKDYETFVLIGDGWDALEYWNNGTGRWMNDNASIKIISNKDFNAVLYFEVGSFYNKRPLNIYFNENLFGEYMVELQNWPDNTPQNITLPLNLSKGENIIRFNSPDKGTIPSDVGAWRDERELGLAFQNITLTTLS